MQKIFLDLDGVLVEFLPFFLKYNGFEVDVENEWPIKEWLIPPQYSKEGMWDDLPMEFWATLPQTPWCQDLVDLCIEQFGQDNVFLATSAANGPSAAGKVVWIENNLKGKIDFKNLIILKRKEVLAQKDHFLIDDCDANIEIFNKCGGNGLLFPRRWNELYEIKVNNAYNYIEEVIKEIGVPS